MLTFVSFLRDNFHREDTKRVQHWLAYADKLQIYSQLVLTN